MDQQQKKHSTTVVGLHHITTLRGHAAAVSAVRFSPCGRFLATASLDRCVFLWCTQTWRHLDTLCGHALGINDIAWSPAGDSLASCSDDTTICLWAATAATEEEEEVVTSGHGPGGVAADPLARLHRVLKGHCAPVFCLAYSPHASILASGSFDESVRLWSTIDGACARVVVAHADPVTGIEFSADGSVFATAASDGLVRVWRARTGRCLRTMTPVAGVPCVSGVKWGAAGALNVLLASNLDSTIVQWDSVNAKPMRVLKGHRNTRLCTQVCWANLPDANDTRIFVCCGDEDGSIFVWDAESGEIVAKRTDAHDDAVIAVDFTSAAADSNLLASGGLRNDRSVKIWTLRSPPPATQEPPSTTLPVPPQLESEPTCV